jgi:adenylyltransferase/sulfurtransferase
MVGDDHWQDRYSRQIALEPVGHEGQRRLGQATVAVVGAGALGSNSADLLVRMGFGHVRLIDRDVVETSNLHRFRVLGDVHVDRSKADALAEELTAATPGPVVEGMAEDLTAANALGLLEGADVVVDGLDNMETRYIINDACLELGIPWVYGGVVGTTGMEAPFPANGPCLRCLFPDPPEPGLLPTCESAGIHPSTPSVIAAVQVAHASRLLLDKPVESRLLTMDLWTDYWRTVEFQRREDCPACTGGSRDFLDTGAGEIATSLCGQDAVQINPPQRATVDLDAKEREWAALGKVTRSGQVLILDLGNVRLQLFTSGRALVKGTAEVAVAKTLYARYVGH